MHEVEANVAAHGDLLFRWMREAGRQDRGIINFGKTTAALPALAQHRVLPRTILFRLLFSVWSV
jgi:hypothetical protein